MKYINLFIYYVNLDIGFKEKNSTLFACLMTYAKISLSITCLLMTMLTKKDDIENWLISMNINGYMIHDDLTVSVGNSVNLHKKNLTYFPIQFNTIYGAFDCSNNQLTSLKGAPYMVAGSFNCSENRLTSLDFTPKNISGDFACMLNPIEHFDYSNISCAGEFTAYHQHWQYIPEFSQHYATQSLQEKTLGITLFSISFLKLMKYAKRIKKNQEFVDYLEETLSSQDNVNKIKL